MEYSGLGEFWRIFSRAINISPREKDGYSTVSMITEIGGMVKMEKDEFWDCVETSINQYHSYEYSKMKQKVKQLQQETRAKNRFR